MRKFIPSCTAEPHFTPTNVINRKFCELYNLLNSMANKYDHLGDIIEKEINMNEDICIQLEEIYELNHAYQWEKISELTIELAVNIRILYDILDTTPGLNLKGNSGPENINNWIIEFELGEPAKTPKIKQACNKILHALEFSPRYPQNDDNGLVKVELRGVIKKDNEWEEWIVTINVIEFWLAFNGLVNYLQDKDRSI